LLAFFVLVSLFMPLYLQAASWDAGFGKLGWFSLARETLAEPLLSGWRGAIWVHGLAAIPWVVLIVATNIAFVEGEYEELALLEVPTATVIWNVTLRRCLPAIGVSALWITLVTAGEMTVTDLFQVRTYAEEIYTAIPLGNFQELGLQWRALALTVTALTMVALVTTFLLAPRGVTTAARRPVVFRTGAAKPLLLLFASSTALLLVGVPLLNLCVNAGAVVRPANGGLERGWEAAKAVSMVLDSPRRFAAEFGWSLAVAALAATATIAAAIPLAWRFPWRGMPYVVPGALRSR
jgi:iron(III) transport system permease protein